MITRFESGHPIPDEQGLKAGELVESCVKNLKKKDLLICLISGGASALLVDPPENVPLKDKATLTAQLLHTNANIHEINTVRRHLSKLKGGRLVELCPATILSFILSDVAGNSLQDIGSGLTVADPTTYSDSVRVLNRHHLWSKAPRSIISHLKNGINKKVTETPKPDSPIFKRVHNFIIAENRDACEAAKRALVKHNVRCEILTSSAEMNVKTMGILLTRMAQAEAGYRSRQRAIIIGGETTLEVLGRGMGGRNQETALITVNGIAGLKGTVIAAMGTDGIDGQSPAAGAIADGNTLQRASNLMLDPQKYLQNNDSYHFFKALHDNIVTDRTGTNVGDIYLMVRA
jgi:glycerate-2-kinase